MSHSEALPARLARLTRLARLARFIVITFLVPAAAGTTVCTAVAGDDPGLFARESHFTELLGPARDPVVRFQPSFPSTAFVWMLPIAGDFDGDGKDTVGLFDPWLLRFHLGNVNAPAAAAATFSYGAGSVYPLCGDFDGDGTDTIGTYDPATGVFALRNSNSSGPADLTFAFGAAGSYPLVGDFDGDGIDTIGVYSAATATFSLRNSNTPGAADVTFVFGPAGSVPFVGDHDGDGSDSIAVLHAPSNTIQIRHSNDFGAADEIITLDPVDWPWTPISGNWHVPGAPTPRGYEFTQAAPASQGFDPVALDDAIAEAATMPPMRSLLVLRHGVLVSETYFGGASRELAGNIKSASKSILSALYGVAIAGGTIADPTATVRDYLPEVFIAELDHFKSTIRIDHLLTMTAGLAWNESDLAPFFFSPDWGRYVVAQPLTASPGTSFLYSTGLTHLASRVLTAAGGQPTSEIARTTLLEPMGIEAVRWDRDTLGYDMGGAEVYMVPRDLARFGQVFLDGGIAELRRIVPRRWIEASTAEIIPPDWIDGDLSYGAWWWRKEIGGHTDLYFAWGYGGQLVFLFPSLDLNVTVTSRWGVSGAEAAAHAYAVFDWLEDHLLPAVE